MTQAWRRCEQCRKVKGVDDYEEDNPACRTCMQGRRSSRSTAASAPGGTTTVRTQRRTPVGTTGLGDVEVRTRRARARALEALANAHPEEFADLLAAERRSEGLL